MPTTLVVWTSLVNESEILICNCTFCELPGWSPAAIAIAGGIVPGRGVCWPDWATATDGWTGWVVAGCPCGCCCLVSRPGAGCEGRVVGGVCVGRDAGGGVVCCWAAMPLVKNSEMN